MTHPGATFPPRPSRAPAATIRELKEQRGKDIWLWGSLKLMHTLLDAGVVDEVRMLVYPASRGKGTRIFQDRQERRAIRVLWPNSTRASSQRDAIPTFARKCGAAGARRSGRDRCLDRLSDDPCRVIMRSR